MKQLIALVMLIMMMVSCTPNGEEVTRKDNSIKPTKDYRIVIIDGCEYIEIESSVSTSRIYSLTHKGNCKNSIH
jgi:hypothetical protein